MTVVQYRFRVLSAWLALFLMVTTEVTKVPFLATDPPCIYHVLVGWIIGRKLQGSHHCIHNWSLQNSVPIIWWCDIPILRYMPRKSNIGLFCWLVYLITRIGVFACGQILCISPNGLQASRGINWIWFIPFSHRNKLTWCLHSAIYCIAPWKRHCCSHRNDEIAY